MIVQWIKWSWLYIYSEKVCTVIVILVDFPPPIRAPPACKSNLLSKVGRVSENLATVWVSIYWDPYSVKQMWNYLRRFFPSHSHYFSKFNWSMPKLTPATATFWFFLCVCVDYGSNCVGRSISMSDTRSQPLQCVKFDSLAPRFVSEQHWSCP